MAQPATNQTTRQLVMERRKAMSTSGKTAIKPTAATTSRVSAPSMRTAPTTGGSARDASRARREAMSQGGKAAIQNKDRTRQAPGAATASAATPSTPASAAERPKGGCGCGCNGTKTTCTDGRNNDTQAASTLAQTASVAPMAQQGNNVSTARAASLARREAMSTRGKAGLSSNGMSAARAGNPALSSRETAMAMREQRSRNGKSGEEKCKPTGHVRPQPGAETGAAQDQPWKVGAGETTHGQAVTGTMVGRSASVTGDEPSTCRTVTGTEYLGADIFREFCQSEIGKTPSKVGVSQTSAGSRVTGNQVGRGKYVTGNEPGTCKRVTGNEYVGANQIESYCGTKAKADPSKITSAETRKRKAPTGTSVGPSSKVTGDETGADRQPTGTKYMQRGDDRAPNKVATSETLRGGSITGTMVGRSGKVTGDEPGSCTNVTGDDYVGAEQFSKHCKSMPAPTDRKVGVSSTLMGQAVTGTMTDRGANVTGNEAGTCKALTGTPYAGEAQTETYCSSPEKAMAMARARKGTTNVGPSMTGLQPGINGVMTGAEKGACEPVTGTAYVGADQAASTCPATAATPASPDFPQAIDGTAPWSQFSVTQPSGGAQQGGSMRSVTGSRYEQGHITGPFGMASGKVTGTEEARFDNKGAVMPAAPIPATTQWVDGRVKSRITGEGMDVGLKITGDDWERNERVTGTEGMSAARRNPTMRGPTASMAVENKRNEAVPVPVSKVTGSSGNTEKGSLITYSGGARG